MVRTRVGGGMSVVAAVDTSNAASRVSVIVTWAVCTPVTVGVTVASIVGRLVPALIELDVDVQERTVSPVPDTEQLHPEVLGAEAKDSSEGRVAVTVGPLLVGPPVDRTDASSARV